MTDDAMRFGVLLSSIDADIARDSRRIEEQGWDFLTTGEHVSFNIPIANAFVSLSAAAAATTTIELMSAVTLLPLYPAVLAAMALVVGFSGAGAYSIDAVLANAVAALDVIATPPAWVGVVVVIVTVVAATPFGMVMRRHKATAAA